MTVTLTVAYDIDEVLCSNHWTMKSTIKFVNRFETECKYTVYRVAQNYTLGKLSGPELMISRFMNTRRIKFCQNRSCFKGCAKTLKLPIVYGGAVPSDSNIIMLMIFSNVPDPFGLAF